MGSARTRASATSYANKKRVACSDTETVFNKVMQSMTYLPRMLRRTIDASFNNCIRDDTKAADRQKA